MTVCLVPLVVDDTAQTVSLIMVGEAMTGRMVVFSPGFIRPTVAQAATHRVWDRKPGYQVRNIASHSSFKTRVRICSRRCAPRLVHCIYCFFTMRLLTTWFTVDSTKPVLIRSPW
jgi:hypothetical protein